MKTVSNFIYTLVAIIAIVGCSDNNSYLTKVVNNLEEIEYATYYTVGESLDPTDTTHIVSGMFFIKEYNNPVDTTIGASVISFNGEDTTELNYCYDGNISIVTYHDKKGVVVDDFTFRKLPFRPMNSPFFNKVKNIIKYALTTQDSITTDFKEFDDYYHLKMVIYEDRQVEFFGEACYVPKNPYTFDPTSRYEVWISKSNDLPYKIRREMEHNISIMTCKDAKISKSKVDNFNAYDYIPKDYEIRKYGDRKNRKSTSELVGKKSIDWTLNDADGEAVSLSDLKSKLVLINVTGIGCGPCRVAIPFLNDLKDKFNATDLEVVALESWGRSERSMQNYIKKYKMNYLFLSSTDEVTKSYNSQSVPTFFILDNQRIIRNVFNGYSEKSTDEKIIKAIEKLL